MLQGKKILLGVTGSIAAYKIAPFVRLLISEGAEVQVVMTNAATEFIPALTLSTLSQNPVMQNLSEEGQWNNHVALGRWADVMLIAPASANTLAKMQTGLCDNLLMAVYLSATCPVFIAPAMDTDMWEHPATKRNIKYLTETGHHLIPVEEGALASGLQGMGRMAEPEAMRDVLKHFFSSKANSLEGKRALVTAGPTYEPIDPVRFIGNHSSGKMGIALAEALASEGAEVDLVLGPVSLRPAHPSIKVHAVNTTLEMQKVCQKLFPQADLTILAAAVSDYRPAKVAAEKIKKISGSLELRLEKNPDILKQLGKQKKEGQILVGFALETQNAEENALKKLQEKNLDFIALNSLRDAGAGFKTDTNKVTLYHKSGKKTNIPLQTKREVAKAIIQSILSIDEKQD